MLQKLLLKLSRNVQVLPIKLGHAFKSKTFIAYQPDAFSHFGDHNEVRNLWLQFTAGNMKNNGGDLARLWSILLNCKQIDAEGIAGDFAEVGVWRGNSAAVLAHFAKQQSRRVALFDPFNGFRSDDIEVIDRNTRVGLFSDTNLEIVKRTIASAWDICDVYPGYFPDTVTQELSERRFSLVNLDCDLYKPMRAGLSFFYPRMSSGGLLMLHDYSSSHWKGAKQAVDEFCSETGERIVLMPDKSGSAFLRKVK